MSSWDTTISVYGPPTPYEFLVTDTNFATDPEDEYNPDIPRLNLIGIPNDPDWEDFTMSLKVGKGWEVVDSGAAVEHTSGKKQFDGRSAYGEFIDSIVKNPGGNDNLETLKTELQEAGESFQASIWVGKRIVVDVRKKTATIDGEKSEYGRLIVVDYLGSDDEAAESAAQNREQANAAAMERITELALTHDSHAQFTDAVLSEGLSSDPDITRKVMDPSSDGLWETIRKEADA